MVISVPGYFSYGSSWFPCCFGPGLFRSMVISVLGHSRTGSFRSRVISV